MNKLIHCFFNADFRLGHLGLGKLCRQNKIDPDTLEPGTFICFLNSAKNKIKILAPNHVLAYYRHPLGHKLNLSALKFIPQAFHSKGKFDYDEALKKLLESELSLSRK